MGDSRVAEIAEKAKAWTLEAGARLALSHQEKLNVEYKTSAADIVTQKDKEIEQFFVENIKTTYPGHYVLGEEGLSDVLPTDTQNGVVWIIDPIDGTTNFVHQHLNYAISVAIYIEGEPTIGYIYDPIKKELFSAIKNQGAYLNDQQLSKLASCSLEEAVICFNHLWLVPNEKVNYEKMQRLVSDVRGIRYLGSAALEMAYVACGRLDSSLDFRLSPWDIAAGIVILNEVGAEMTTLENQSINVFTKSSTIFSRPGIHQDILEYLS